MGYGRRKEGPEIRPKRYSQALEECIRHTGVFSTVHRVPNGSGALPSDGATYIVDTLTPAVEAAVVSGATAICVNCKGKASQTPVAYSPGLWATMGTGGARGVGTYVLPFLSLSLYGHSCSERVRSVAHRRPRESQAVGDFVQELTAQVGISENPWYESGQVRGMRA